METPLSPLDFARRARRLYADRESVVDGSLRLTYREFFERCDRWSSALQKLGVQPGDRVATIAPNTHAHLEAFYAIPQIGAVIVPINFRLTAADFAYILKHSGAKVVCVHGDYLDAVDSIRGQGLDVEHFIAFSGQKAGWIDYESALTAATTEFTPAEVVETEMIALNYTSGTTANPKGVMVTHRNTAMNIMGHLMHTRISAADRYLWVLPMFHANGWCFVWTITAVGGRHVCIPKADPRLIFETIKREAVTLLCAAPTVLISIANAPEDVRKDAPRGVRVFTAGAPPAAATIERVEGELGWEITHVYGLTEVSPIVTISEPRPEHASLHPAVRAVIKSRQGVEYLGNAEVRVVDDEGNEVAPDGAAMGEIIIRGNAVMKGYYNDPAATEKAIHNGWFHSGDAAVVHPDGYIEIRDRWKDIIISGGENISSVEVEGVLLRHPAVQEAAVVGLPHEKWGETPQAFIVLKPAAETTTEALRLFCREHLAHFKVPHGFEFIAELPKTATGKIQKYVLRGGRANITKQ
ncbi:MAG: long-chain-fatty-acid--CoA ligase [Prosthecobacter sp.]|jgi:fatty-acyl-CoA synthase|uniref:long-chain-fatty-acid--CoA ligase n=1 Tax=Prosthecobacter sp. TaxID=1965333 RepID=UPI0019E3BFF2|nr:long-chain-fatty-acid--CoA ligase [Prosthecobacter sp.]MBE2284002.1 long-chain-fatty-acid--CoA ligase [Prosthecobacter sp.]